VIEIVKGRSLAPDRILVYGRPGVGKSTFAAGATNPLFIDVERGSGALEVDRVHPCNWKAVLEVIRNWPEGYPTLVIDTLDALEKFVFADVCSEADVKTIEDIGYGKGYARAIDRWVELLGALDTLRIGRGVEIILIAHATVRSMTNPGGSDYTKWELAVHAKSVGFITAWADTIAFADIDHTVTNDEKILVNGRRILRLAPGAWEAKCRYRGTPAVIDNSYEAYAAARSKAGAKSAKELLAEAQALAVQIPDLETQKKVVKFIEENQYNAAKLASAIDRIKKMENSNGMA
jgi:hypothetical protein